MTLRGTEGLPRVKDVIMYYITTIWGRGDGKMSRASRTDEAQYWV